MEVEVYTYPKTRGAVVRLALLLFFATGAVLSAWGISFSPLIKQFGKHDYKAQSQNWSISEDRNGYIWVGNSGGLLRFDGTHWEQYQLPGRKTVRTVKASQQDRIFVGARQEFGYFKPDLCGVYTYYSLSDSLSEKMAVNEDIWSIIELPDGELCFQSFSFYYLYNGSSIRRYPIERLALFFRLMAGSVYSYVEGTGFVRWKLHEGTFEPVENAPFHRDVVEIISLKQGSWLIVTAYEGLYLFDGIRYTRLATQIEPYLTQSIVNRATLTPRNVLLLGSISNGLAAISLEGELLWNLQTDNGLNNNTILALLCDHQGNCWVGMDNGIAHVLTDKPMSIAKGFTPSVGMIYDVSRIDDRVYLGTNQGLFWFPVSGFRSDNHHFNPVRVKEFSGQVWDITPVGDRRVVGYNFNTGLLTGSSVSRLSSQGGGFCFTQGTIYDHEVAFQGHYSGIAMYERKPSGEWEYTRPLQGFDDATRFIEIDHRGRLWSSHSIRGVSMTTLAPDLTHTVSVQRFDKMSDRSSERMNVFKVEGRIVICDYDSLYTYDDISGRFVTHSINRMLGEFAGAHRIVNAGRNNYWFIKANKAALVAVEQDSCSVIDVVDYRWFGNDVVDDYEQVRFLDSLSVFCLDNALVLYYHGKGIVRKPQLLPGIRMDRIECFSTENTAHKRVLPIVSTEKSPVELKENNLLFRVDVPGQQDLRLSYQLSGEVNRTTVSGPGLFECSQLPSGEYRLTVSTVGPIAVETERLSYWFIVLPLWYQTVWFRILLVILLVGVIVLFNLFVYRRLKIVGRLALEKQEEEMSQLLEHQRQEVTRMENELLQEKLKQKTKELASTSLSLITKNNVLERLQEELEQQRRELGTRFPQYLYERISRLIRESQTSQEDWELFKVNFDKVHEDFYRRLHAEFPSLSPSELRLCAYIQLNIPSKEIARILDVSPKAIEVSRYRLRKKLGISPEKSLLEFLLERK